MNLIERILSDERSMPGICNLGGGNPSQTTTQTQSSNPIIPKWLLPLLQQTAQRGVSFQNASPTMQSLYANPPQQAVAPPTLGALQAIAESSGMANGTFQPGLAGQTLNPAAFSFAGPAGPASPVPTMLNAQGGLNTAAMGPPASTNAPIPVPTPKTHAKDWQKAYNAFESNPVGAGWNQDWGWSSTPTGLDAILQGNPQAMAWAQKHPNIEYGISQADTTPTSKS